MSETTSPGAGPVASSAEGVRAPSAGPPPTAQVLVVDDEPDHAEVMAEALRRLGHVCTLVHGLDEAQEELRHGAFDLVVTDLVMAGEADGMAVLETARETQPGAETVMVTAHGDIPTAVEAVNRGAFHFIEKPLDLAVFRSLCAQALEKAFLRSQNENLRQQIDEQFGFEGILGQSPPMRELITRLKQVAPTDIPVLITGES
ncbi:MAG: response regulator, partial [Planctomycetota bacterium]